MAANKGGKKLWGKRKTKKSLIGQWLHFLGHRNTSFQGLNGAVEIFWADFAAQTCTHIMVVKFKFIRLKPMNHLEGTDMQRRLGERCAYFLQPHYCTTFEWQEKNGGSHKYVCAGHTNNGVAAASEAIGEPIGKCGVDGLHIQIRAAAFAGFPWPQKKRYIMPPVIWCHLFSPQVTYYWWWLRYKIKGLGKWFF